MQRLKQWLFRLMMLALLAGLGYVALGLFFSQFLVDLWWFQSQGYSALFGLRLTYKYLVFLGFSLIFFVVFFLNFWITGRFLSRPAPADSQESKRFEGFRKVAAHFRRGSLRVYTPFSLLLGVSVAYPLYRDWEAALLYVFGPAAGVVDPVFGKDISYYLFSLPIYLLLLDELFIAFGLLLVGLLLLYWLEKRLLAKEGLALSVGAKIHLTVILLVMFSLAIWEFLLQRHLLVYVNTHAGLFSGPGYVEMRVLLPLIWLAILLLAGMALTLVFYLYRRQGLLAFLICLVSFGLALGARYSAFLPEMVDKYIVKPNEISQEKPFIASNIQATLAAYKLTQVEKREFHLEDLPWDARAPQLQRVFRNIPVWDREVLQQVFEQLQELRTYYTFNAVTVDRYPIRGVTQQVFLAPRELNLKELPVNVQNWINRRLKYTHGYGVVMTPAAQGGEEPLTWYIQGIPPASEYGFTIKQPDIYYGVGSYEPVIVPNDSRELGYPTEEGHTLTDYQGSGGVPISSLWRKLIFSLYFQEKDILFTTKTSPHSRILFRRQLGEMIHTLAPFFQLDKDPYIVVTETGLFWIQDAYTVSDRYPCAQPYEDRLNYIRNSVKIVVDAYNGKVDFYLSDPEDPIIQAYRRIYPGLLKDLSQLPAELKAHLRYPRDLFNIQMSLYAKYHQTDPEIFYKQEDLWEFPEIQREDTPLPLRPYYLTLNLFNPEKFDFLLLCPMTPRARANLRSLCVVGCDGENYGKIVIYSFPKGALVFGPSQVNALIHQDTTISELFTLWNQQGSKVDRGRMIVLPLAGAIFYIQPVYLKAAGPLKIPQLKRLIVSKGEIMTMQPNLEEAFQKLAVRFQKRTGSTGKPAPEPEASSPGRQDEAGAAPTFPDTR